jgi:anti-sigma regulatory factor (Ser/Thr protein kinase)
MGANRVEQPYAMNACCQNFATHHDSLSSIMEFIVASASSLSFDDDATRRLQLSAEELFTNSVKYGRPGAGDRVSLQLTRCDEGIELIYEDGCDPWDPFANLDRSHHRLSVAERPVGGLGIALVEGLAVRVEYQRVEQRNRIKLWVRG